MCNCLCRIVYITNGRQPRGSVLLFSFRCAFCLRCFLPCLNYILLVEKRKRQRTEESVTRRREFQERFPTFRMRNNAESGKKNNLFT